LRESTIYWAKNPVDQAEDFPNAPHGRLKWLIRPNSLQAARLIFVWSSWVRKFLHKQAKIIPAKKITVADWKNLETDQKTETREVKSIKKQTNKLNHK